MFSMPINSDLDLEMTEKPNSIFTIEREDDVLKTGSPKTSPDYISVSDDVRKTSEEVIRNIRLGIIND